MNTFFATNFVYEIFGFIGFFLIGIIFKFLGLVIPLLLAVAYSTLLERKVLSAFHRRRGPNMVGIWGLLQPLADGLKLFAKETTLPSQANRIVFLCAPIITFFLSLVTWVVIPFEKGVVYADLSIGIMFLLAISSLSVYGIIMAGWSSNSKYPFLGALRSAAQMVSYEVSVGLLILTVVLCAGNLNLTNVVMMQQFCWYIFPLWPSFIMFYVSGLAETNRPPFDLPEAEAELVSGYNVEYSGMGFALFFLGEYAHMILMSTLLSLLFFGGWLFPGLNGNYQVSYSLFILAVKVVLFFFSFLWVRATFPRYRYDQLMRLGWKVFLPLSLGWLIFVASFVFCLHRLCSYELFYGEFFIYIYYKFMSLLIVFLPFFSAIISGLFSRWLGFYGACILTVVGVFVAFLLSWVMFFNVVLFDNIYHISMGLWMDSEWFLVFWGFVFDSLSVTMLVVVTTISLLVHIYSTSYMETDPHLARFMTYLSVFTLFMLLLVTADNMVQLFLGWEGVGLSSYLLINFWFTRIQANKAAMKAMIVNKFGDVGVILGLIFFFVLTQTVQFDVAFSIVPFYKNVYLSFFCFDLNALTIIAFCFLFGAVGKSAQIGLHTWLPDAMEGPTPVSALIHAATMVTAGVFLLLRCSIIFEFAPSILVLVTFIGGITAFFAATCGLFQQDLKKVIAYSTCSQLGYMVFICGLSHYHLALFHLVNHAFFKALLFLGAGSIIHAFMDEQDMRKMGGLFFLLPFTYIFMLISSFSLMGFPFLTGFYSKDMILEVSYATFYFDGAFVYWLGVGSAGLTAFYSFRLIYQVFLRRTNAFKVFILNTHESEIRMLIPMCILYFASIFFGYLFRDLLVGMGCITFFDVLYVYPFQNQFLEFEFIPWHIKLLPFFISSFGALFSIFFYHSFFSKFIFGFSSSNFFGWNIFHFFSNKWFFDALYNQFIVKNFLTMGYTITLNIFDRGLVETFGPYGVFWVINVFKHLLCTFQSGQLYHYAFFILFSVFIFISVSVSSIVGFFSGFDFILFFLSAIVFIFYFNVPKKFTRNVVNFKIRSSIVALSEFYLH